MEKIDTVDAVNLPKSVFGVTFDDAVEYGEKLDGRQTIEFVNEPVRNTDLVTLWEFMESELSEEDEIEITETMKILTGEFC